MVDPHILLQKNQEVIPDNVIQGPEIPEIPEIQEEWEEVHLTMEQGRDL